MTRTIIQIIMFVFIVPAASAQACDKTFDSVLQHHTKAIDDRDLTAYIATVAPRDSQLMILADGSTWKSIGEIKAGHKQWFADPTWTFNKTLVRKDLRENWGLVVYKVTVDRPEKPGTPFLLTMMFAPEDDGCWYLQHDQNTLLPSSPK